MQEFPDASAAVFVQGAGIYALVRPDARWWVNLSACCVGQLQSFRVFNQRLDALVRSTAG